VEFESFLHSKKISSEAFKAAELELWESWKRDFEQMSPASFTSRMLFLINPIRRKYPAPNVPEVQPPDAPKAVDVTSSAPSQEQKAPQVQPPKKPVVPRPVMRPKPKTS